MKIKVTSPIPVENHMRPKIGEVYEVIRKEQRYGMTIYFVSVNGREVGVFHKRECEVVQP